MRKIFNHGEATGSFRDNVGNMSFPVKGFIENETEEFEANSDDWDRFIVKIQMKINRKALSGEY